jgi:hypothetical protein
MTASIAIRIRYKDSVAILPSGGMLREPDAFSSRRRLPPFIPVRGYQPQNWSGVLRQWSSFRSAPRHACKQAARCFAQSLHSLLCSVFHAWNLAAERKHDVQRNSASGA